ncbi:MAG: polyamine aminopropyltransferase [Alphaproteobacteria bacterium]|nr:polyamine aminopropyltransferase [Alphaproteobacteria bacterium]
MTFEETLHLHWGQVFKVRRTLLHERTEFQDLVVFESETFGRVLALDGVIQTTEADEAHYHEMLAHVPILAHGNARDVLIVGGGDGGILREVVKHPGVNATLVEIDPGVIEMSRKHLPSLSDGAFDHPRARVVIGDGAKFVAGAAETFDVIIVDSTDPHGPGAVLFSEAFYADCRRRLAPGGIMVTQNGVPFLQPDELGHGWRRLRSHFDDVWFYVTAVPTYLGGLMTLGWASLDPACRRQSVESIRSRFDALGLKTRYYTPDIHVGSFALPRYIQDLMAE